MADNTTRERYQSAHLGDGEDGTRDQDTNEEVAKKRAQRTTASDSFAATKEETSADGACCKQVQVSSASDSIIVPIGDSPASAII